MNTKLNVVTKLQERKTALVKYYGSPVELTTKSGFPVLVWVKLAPSDLDVGIMTSYISEFEITTHNYCDAKFLNIPHEDQEDILCAAHEKVARTY
jgi:hypothetical protein